MTEVKKVPFSRETFHDRWVRSLSRPHVMFPKARPAVMLTFGIGKRFSTCQICSNKILKGEKRVEFLLRMPRRWPSGGGSAGEICFFHPECLASFAVSDIGTFTPPPSRYWQPPVYCFDCRNLIDTEKTFSLVVSSSTWVKLCAKCARQPCYRRCEICEMMHPFNRTSRILSGCKSDLWPSASEPQTPLEGWICKRCDAEEVEIVSERSLVQERKFMKHVMKVVDETKTWLGSSGET